MIGNLYVIVNQVNNKCYIGKTYNTVEKRFQEHIRESRKDRCKNRPLYKAMKKYGIENFMIKYLGSYEEDTLEEKEIEYIQKYNSYIKDNGYNATLGGDSKKYLQLDEQKVIQKYNELKYVNSVAEYFDCDVSNISKILKHNNIDVHIGNYKGFIPQNKKIVDIIQYDKEMNVINHFNYIIDCAKWIFDNCDTQTKNINTIYRQIIKCLNNEKKSYCNYVWQYNIGSMV